MNAGAPPSPLKIAKQSWDYHLAQAPYAAELRQNAGASEYENFLMTIPEVRRKHGGMALPLKEFGRIYSHLRWLKYESQLYK